jgi:hypothetical protein
MNRYGTLTQGGALRRLPWATLRRPYRAETSLGGDLQVPSPPGKKWAHPPLEATVGKKPNVIANSGLELGDGETCRADL